MSNFSFPPPPPPPPRAAPDFSYPAEAPQRGRGGYNFRGRDGPQNRSRGNGGRGYHSTYDDASSHGQGQRRGNANFTQVSQQSHLGYDTQPSAYGQSQPHQGIKRKRGDFHDPRGRGSGSHPTPRPKVAVAPAVPAFGGSLPGPFPPPASKVHADLPKPTQHQLPKKRKTNFLGLTPDGIDAESSSEDDNDEESALAATNNPLLIEYRGQTMSLGSKADIKAWIAERKKRWPTKERVELREAEDKKRRDEQAEARRKVIESRNEEQIRRREVAEQERRTREEAEIARKEAEKAARKLEKNEKQGSKETKEEKQRKKLEKLLAKAEKLKKKIQREGKDTELPTRIDLEMKPEVIGGSISLTDPTTIAENLGRDAEPQPALSVETVQVEEMEEMEVVRPVTLNCETPWIPQPHDEVQPKSIIPVAVPENISAVITHGDGLAESSEDSDLDDSTDSSSESDSDDDNSSTTSSAPEETSARIPVSGLPPVPPPSITSARICRDFASKGYCRAGDHCRYRHELPERGSRSKEQAKEKKERVPRDIDVGRKKERKTLWQRLVEQEQEQESRTAAMAIRFMGENGMLGTFEIDAEQGMVMDGDA
jgi:hypothetical protein